jgi:hypothetical protein
MLDVKLAVVTKMIYKLADLGVWGIYSETPNLGSVGSSEFEKLI